MPAADRPDPIALLEAQAASRVPELVPIRYGRMLVSPFTFYRGAALIQATDLSTTPVSGITVQLCGDAHLSNFGLFGTPERQLLFDINDFDETLPGPWEWDVKRLAGSFEIMGRFRGFSRSDRRAAVKEAIRAYRERMSEAADMGTLAVWYEHLEIGRLLDDVRGEVRRGQLSKKEHRTAKGHVAKARTRDSVRVFTRRVGKIDDELRIVADPPVIVPVQDLVEPGSEWEQTDVLIKKLLASYRKTLGIEHHPLLQVKEAEASVLERFVGKSEYPHHGQRVVAGQRLMQGATDAFLGWQRIKGLDGKTRDYYVRQLHDWKGGAEVEELLVPGATVYARICGATLARAHARWGDRIAIASYLGKGDSFDRAIADYASAYADQNERDYEALVHAVKRGRLLAEIGV